MQQIKIVEQLKIALQNISAKLRNFILHSELQGIYKDTTRTVSGG